MSSCVDILYAGLSAVSRSEIITPKKAEDLGITAQVKVISINEVFEHTYHPIKFSLHDQLTFNENPWIDIKIKTLTGMTIKVKVNKKFTIAQVKDAIEEEDHTLPADRQKLVFNSKQLLHDEETVESLGISDGDAIFLVLLLRGGGPTLPLVLDPSFLDPKYDYDFTNKTDDGKEYWRGKYEEKPLRYYRPYGWYRHALKVLGKYKDDTWLGIGGIRTGSSNGEWPVGYHGTSGGNAPGIVQEGFKIGDRAKYGKGVYTTPNFVWVSKSHYPKEFTHDGKKYKLVFQNRVNTQSDHLHIVKDADGPGVDYWVSKKHDAKTGVWDVRPYGILIKPV